MKYINTINNPKSCITFSFLLHTLFDTKILAPLLIHPLPPQNHENHSQFYQDYQVLKIVPIPKAFVETKVTTFS